MVTLREVDEGLKKVLEELVYLDKDGNSVPVRVIYATPEKAFAKDTRQSLPIVSFFRVSVIPNPSRFNAFIRPFYGVPVRREDLDWDITKFTPVDVQYQVDVWCKYYSDVSYLQTQLAHWFSYGGKINCGGLVFPVFLEDLSDASELESDSDDRVLRFVATLRMESWLSAEERMEKHIEDIVEEDELL
jgi:hypothetical protein